MNISENMFYCFILIFISAHQLPAELISSADIDQVQMTINEILKSSVSFDKKILTFFIKIVFFNEKSDQNLTSLITATTLSKHQTTNKTIRIQRDKFTIFPENFKEIGKKNMLKFTGLFQVLIEEDRLLENELKKEII